MKLWYSPYELRGVGGKVRPGALVRVDFPIGLTGHADCHPWPELGDGPLEDQLRALAQGAPTPLTARLLETATLDARGRAAGRSLFDGCELPPSHFLLAAFSLLSEDTLAPLVAQGFTRFKLKVGLHSREERAALARVGPWLSREGAKLRLDFNGRLTRDEFLAYCKESSAWLGAIDFIEDPIPYDELAWGELVGQIDAAFALDRCEADAPCSQAALVRVLKPAIQEASQLARVAARAGRRLVVTSYLDHPLGQVAAAHEATRIARELPGSLDFCGLLSHHVYDRNTFSEALRNQGPWLQAPEGTGLGFDALLDAEDWRPIACA